MQKALLDRWRSELAQADLTTVELLALVLDDDGRSPSTHHPFTQKILESYDPTKALWAPGATA